MVYASVILMPVKNLCMTENTQNYIPALLHIFLLCLSYSVVWLQLVCKFSSNCYVYHFCYKYWILLFVVGFVQSEVATIDGEKEGGETI